MYSEMPCQGVTSDPTVTFMSKSVTSVTSSGLGLVSWLRGRLQFLQPTQSTDTPGFSQVMANGPCDFPRVTPQLRVDTSLASRLQ